MTMAPTLIITMLVELFKAGYEIKQIVDSPSPETEEEYRKRIEELLDVPTLEDLREKHGKKEGE